MDLSLSMRTRFRENPPETKAGIIFMTLVLPILCYGFIIWFVFFYGRLYDDPNNFMAIIVPLFFATGFLWGFGKDVIIPHKFTLTNEGLFYSEMGEIRLKRTKLHWESIVAVISSSPKGRKLVFIQSRKDSIVCGYGFSEPEKEQLMDIMRKMQRKHGYQIIEDVGAYDVLSIIMDISEGRPIKLPEKVETTGTDDAIWAVQAYKVLAMGAFGIGAAWLVVAAATGENRWVAVGISAIIASIILLSYSSFKLSRL